MAINCSEMPGNGPEIPGNDPVTLMIENDANIANIIK